MTLEMARDFFMLNSIINYCVLFTWVILFVFARNLMKSMSSKLLRLKINNFDIINYCGIAIYKIGIILFNIAPWIACSVILK